MATAVIMPKQGQSVESCVITSWEKHVGDEVHAGECLFTYETDKASFEGGRQTERFWRSSSRSRMTCRA